MAAVLGRRNSDLLCSSSVHSLSLENGASSLMSNDEAGTSSSPTLSQISQLSSRISFSSLAGAFANLPSQRAGNSLHLKVLRVLHSHLDIETIEDGYDVETNLRRELERGREAAFFLGDLGKVVRKYKQWTRMLPRIRPFYAVKCNPDEGILRTLLTLGCGFDCASKNEVETVLSLGAHPEDVIFANPCKMSSHMKYVMGQNVTLMTFDNEAELLKIKNTCPRARLVLRLLPPNASSAVCCFGSKFGADWPTCKSLLQLSQKLDLSVVGVSFHVGSGCFAIQAFIDAIRLARDAFDFAESLGIRMNMLDIGGGFPGCDENTTLSFPAIATVIGPLIDSLFPSSVDIIAEPGRYFATEFASLAVNIIAKRGPSSPSSPSAFAEDISNNAHNIHGYRIANSEPVFDMEDISELQSDLDSEGNVEDVSLRDKPVLYYISDGVYGSFNNTFFDHAHVQPHLLYPERSVGRPLRVSTLFGPTCDSIDKVCDKIILPDLDVGDWIYFVNMGAYTMASSSSFNGFEPPPIKYIMSRC